MSIRGAKTLSRLFQGTIRKRHSGAVEDVIPMIFEKGFVFEPDSFSEEQEKIRDYRSKLVFKDGEFLVRTPLLFKIGTTLTAFLGHGFIGYEEATAM